MKETLKNSRKRDPTGQLVKTKYMHCQTRGCQKWQSIRSQNPFLPTWIKMEKIKVV